MFDHASYASLVKGFIDENGEKMNKGKIEYEKQDMEFYSDGSIKGY